MSMKFIKTKVLNARSIVNNNGFNIIVEYVDTHIIRITESWANKNIADAELGLAGYVLFRRDVGFYILINLFRLTK